MTAKPSTKIIFKLRFNVIVDNNIKLNWTPQVFKIWTLIKLFKCISWRKLEWLSILNGFSFKFLLFGHPFVETGFDVWYSSVGTHIVLMQIPSFLFFFVLFSAFLQFICLGKYLLRLLGDPLGFYWSKRRE